MTQNLIYLHNLKQASRRRLVLFWGTEQPPALLVSILVQGTSATLGLVCCLFVCLLIVLTSAPLPTLFESIVISEVTTVFHLAVGITFL